MNILKYGKKKIDLIHREYYNNAYFRFMVKIEKIMITFLIIVFIIIYYLSP